MKDDPFGVEVAELAPGAERLTAAGVAVGTAPLPYRLDYELETGAAYVTARLVAVARGEGWRRELELSPVTNAMPILRHGLLDGGGPVELTTAWIAVPALSVRADAQRYRHVGSDAGRHIVRFEAVDGTFAADIVLDADALVIEYPAIARRLG